eukprot:SAG22_NODE_20193_length_267_cov_1.541667_1_plen_29_part_10
MTQGEEGDCMFILEQVWTDGRYCHVLTLP